MTPVRKHPDAKFWIEDIVYLKVAREKSPGIITRVSITQAQIAYEVQWDGCCTVHYDFELSTEFVPDYS